MKTTCKIIRLYNEARLIGHTPTAVYVDERVYNNLCQEHHIEEDEVLSTVYGLKVIVRFDKQTGIHLI